MEAYTSFASLYDIFMEDTPYDEWLAFIIAKFEKYKVPKELVLDLGCGTGTMTEKMAARGYDMIGIDLSTDMLQAANIKKNLAGSSSLYLQQDMRELELFGTVKAVISLCDSVNYIVESSDLMKVFALVNNYLDPEGIFIFDFNTDYKYREIIGDATIAENREQGSFIWENYYYEKECINEYDLTIFEKNLDGRYDKYVETHFQKGYTPKEMELIISKSGLKLLEMIDADTQGEVTETTERVFVIAREQGKKKS